MSVDIYALCPTPLPDKAAWVQAISEQHFPLLMEPTFDPHKDGGFWPAKLSGKESGFEYYQLLRADWDRLPNLAQPSRFASGVQFSSHSEPTGFVASIFAAVAIARYCRGVVYDPQEEKSYNSPEMEQLISQAQVFGFHVTGP